MRSLQLCLHRSWDRQDLEAPVYKSMECLRDIQWWLHLPRLALGVSSLPGVSRLTLLVSRLRCGVGCPSRSSDRFGACGLPNRRALSLTPGKLLAVKTGLHQFPVISAGLHGGCPLRHHHCGGLPSQGGWHPVSSPQHLGSGDLALDGVPLRPPGSAVPPGLQQRPRGRPVSPSPAPPFRVVAHPDRISFFEKSLVGSDVSRHGRVSPVLGWSSGLRVPSGGPSFPRVLA